MPRLMLPIEEVTDMVTRPVVIDVISQLIDNTRLDRTAHVLFPGAEERVALAGTTILNKNEENQFNQDQLLSIDVTERLEEDAIITRAVLQEEQPPFFVDDNLEVTMKPVYTHTKVELSINARFADKASAIRWRDEMRNKISMTRDTILHRVSYSFTVPLVNFIILREIHRLRENIAGYGEDYDTYLKNHSRAYFRPITNVGGQVERHAVFETQKRIIGMFDFKEEPEKGSRDGQGDTWSISFSYTFEYDKPTAVVMFYPLMVHNQLLKQRYRPKREDYPTRLIEDTETRYARSIEQLSQFESDRDSIHWARYEKGLAVPDFDEFFPSWIPEGTWRVVTYLIALTEKDRVDLVNLKELPKVDFNSQVLHDWILESELPYLCIPGRSVFNITVYENWDHLGYDNFRIDSRYNVVATHNLDLRKTYHVRFGVYWNWDLLDEAAKDRLRARPDIMAILICQMWPQFCGMPMELIADRFLPRDEWDRIWGLIKGDDWWNRHIFYTQQTLFAHALRRDENEVPTTDLYLP